MKNQKNTIEQTAKINNSLTTIKSGEKTEKNVAEKMTISTPVENLGNWTDRTIATLDALLNSKEVDLLVDKERVAIRALYLHSSDDFTYAYADELVKEPLIQKLLNEAGLDYRGYCDDRDEEGEVFNYVDDFFSYNGHLLEQYSRMEYGIYFDDENPIEFAGYWINKHEDNEVAICTEKDFSETDNILIGYCREDIKDVVEMIYKDMTRESGNTRNQSAEEILLLSDWMEPTWQLLNYEYDIKEEDLNDEEHTCIVRAIESNICEGKMWETQDFRAWGLDIDAIISRKKAA